MFDDFVELDSGAAAELETVLQKRYPVSKHPGAGGQAPSGPFQRIFNFFRQPHRGQQQPHSDAEQGGHELQPLAPIADIGAFGNENAISGQEALRLLLCVDDGRAKTTLKQEVLQNINDDRKLFEYLRDQYFTKRS